MDELSGLPELIRKLALNRFRLDRKVIVGGGLSDYCWATCEKFAPGETMADFYILEMDPYAGDPAFWRYSKRADTEAELQGLDCYEDPPRRLRKSDYVTKTTTRLVNPIPPCQSGLPVGGTIYGLRHV
jgi:hypothetical protein